MRQLREVDAARGTPGWMARASFGHGKWDGGGWFLMIR